MHNVLIEHRACPRCGIRRTTWLWPRRRSVCFNCRCQWGWEAPGPLARHLPDDRPHPSR
jgi:hypothetical protein